MTKVVTSKQLQEIQKLVHDSIISSEGSVDILPGKLMSNLKEIIGIMPEIIIKKSKNGDLKVQIKDINIVIGEK